MSETITEYCVVARFRKDEKFHTMLHRTTNLKEAERFMEKVKSECEWEMAHQKCKSVSAGDFGVDTEYQSDFDRVEIRILKREVTPWYKFKCIEEQDGKYHELKKVNGKWE